MVFRNLSCKSNDNKFQNDRNSFIKVVPITGCVWAESGLLPETSMRERNALVLSRRGVAVLFICMEGESNSFELAKRIQVRPELSFGASGFGWIGTSGMFFCCKASNCVA